MPYLDRLRKTVETMPVKEAEFVDTMMSQVDTTKLVPADYGIGQGERRLGARIHKTELPESGTGPTVPSGR